MKFGKIASAVTAVSLAVAPIAAQAQVAETATEESQIGDGMSTPMLLILAAAAAVGLYLIIDDGDDDPISA